MAIIGIWLQLGGISDGHHRCDDLCCFFSPGYVGCKRKSGDPLRTVFPHYPERTAALIYRFFLFPLSIPNLRVDWKRDPEAGYCNHTKTVKPCSFYAIMDARSFRYNQRCNIMNFNIYFIRIQMITVRLTILDRMFQQAGKMRNLGNM